MSAKILIVEDDAELRESLVDQLALHEEFESIGVETGAGGVQAAKAGEIGSPEGSPAEFGMGSRSGRSRGVSSKLVIAFFRAAHSARKPSANWMPKPLRPVAKEFHDDR